MMALQNNQTIPEKKTELDDYKFICKLGYDNEDCTLHYAHVYSYMLCKCMWFNSHDQDYFESQEKIAKASMMSVSAVKLAQKYLIAKGLLVVSKRKTLAFNKNVYKVVDLYKAYDELPSKKITKVNQKKLFVEELDDPWTPF